MDSRLQQLEPGLQRRHDPRRTGHCRGRKGVSREDYHSYRLKIEDNTYLDSKYVASLKKEYTGVFYKRYIEGLWVLAEGIIYDVFDENKHVDKILEPDTFQNYIVACDYGTNNPCTNGFRLPLEAEWEAERNSRSSYNPYTERIKMEISKV